MSKPITKIAFGQNEISIVTFDGHAPIRSWVKKMTRRHALTLAYANNIEAGTRYNIDHVVVDGVGPTGSINRVLATLNDGVVHANGQVPANYV